MKRLSFLHKLKLEKKLDLVEPSEEIYLSYLIKSERCITVAKLAYNAGIFENAVSEAYYAIYNAVTALFYSCGIKCENHSASVILIKQLFGLDNLYTIFSEFKKDRIDNQYYIPIQDSKPIDKQRCDEKIKMAQRFTLELRAYKETLTLKEINNIRQKFELLE